jgi:hypothetical protein
MSTYSQQLQTHYDRHVEQLSVLRQIAAQLTNQEMLTFCNGQITKCLECMTGLQTKLNVIQMAQNCGFSNEQMEAFICDACAICDHLVTEKVDEKVATSKTELLSIGNEKINQVLTTVDEKVEASKTELLAIGNEKISEVLITIDEKVATK